MIRHALTAAAIAVAASLTPLRPYQTNLINDTKVAWLGGAQNVLAVSATGSGKTVVFSHVVAEERAPSCVIAHRHELVSQMSLALARNGVRHRIIGSDALARECRTNHLHELGVSYVDPNAIVAAASVDTLVRMDQNDPWFAAVRLWVMDEAHHVLKHNKWGDAVRMFPNARGLGVTAETERADGYGLGRQNDGLFDAIVIAPTMRDLINMGFLTDYKIYAPQSNINLKDVNITAKGDYSNIKLKKARQVSSITGDVVEHYIRLAMGKLGITFDTDIESATQTAAAFRARGVPAEVVHSGTHPEARREILKRFKNRQILQLVNVDLFGEGFDLPAIEVVSMARATASFNLYKQQFGRALRLLAGKEWAIIIDHVGNVFRHGLPDQIREFTLGRPTPKARREPDENLIPLRNCVECTRAYERIHAACPFCNHTPTIASRSGPEYVDGDLSELDAETLRQMRGEADAIVNTSFIRVPQDAPGYVQAAIRKKAQASAAAQVELRQTIELWAGWRRDKGHTDSQIYRTFFLTYGVDIGTAQTLHAADATELRDRLKRRLDANGVIPLN